MKKIICLILLLLTLSFPLKVFPVEVKGMIMEDTIWKQSDSPYIVTSDVTVLEGVKLIIKAGTVIRFTQKTSLIIFGELNARGTEEKRIIFTAHIDKPYGGFWGGIKFEPNSIGAVFGNNKYLKGSIIEFAIIEYAGGVMYTDKGNDVSYDFTWVPKIFASIYAPQITLLLRNNIIRNITSKESLFGILSAGKVLENTLESIEAGEAGLCCAIQTEDDIIGNKISNIISNPQTNLYGIRSMGKRIENNIIDGLRAKSEPHYSKNSGSTYGIDSFSQPASIKGNIIRNISAFAHFGRIEISGINADDGSTIEDNKILKLATNSDGYGILTSKSKVLGNELSDISGDGIKAYSNSVIKNNKINLVKKTSITGGDHAVIEGNILNGYSLGIELENSATVENNLIKNGEIGIKFTSGIFSQNSIYNNSNYNFYLLGNDDVDITNNYWGTIDKSEIYNKIFDYYKDKTKGKVNFLPFLSKDPFLSYTE